MADKIKRYSDGGYPHPCYEDDDGEYILYTDHQAAMREAGGLLGKCCGALYMYSDGRFSDSPLGKQISAFLSAHQECGGGG